MGSVNKVIILGTLGKNPEIRYLENGRMRVQLTVATHDLYTTKEGTKIDHTDWHEIVLWTPQAEVAARYLAKGRQVYIEGKITYRSYANKDGVQQYTVQITAQQLVLLNSEKPILKGVEVINYKPKTHSVQNDDIEELPL